MHQLEKRNLLPADLKPIQSIDEYQAQGGLKGLERARGMSAEEVIAEVKKSGLRGRGGAGFPTAIKWDTVSKAPDEKKYIVCNMAEGEPGTFKDRYLLSKNPYYVLEGMLIGAHAIGATQAIIATKEKFKSTVERLQNAIKEFENKGICEPGYLRLVLGPDEYLFGEEKALLEVVDGRTAMPRFFPPFLYGVGAGAGETNPTVVNNFESLSHVAKILANGADWFKSMGSEDTPGTVILSLSGDLKRPGMYEVETGLTMRQVFYDLAGGPRDESKPIKVVFSGISNRPMTPDQFDLPLGFGTLRAAGVGLGSAGFMVYDESRSMLQIAWMYSHFLANSSCGQCIPCNMGTRVITELLAKLKDGVGSEKDLEDILIETGRCTNQTRCFLPQQESIVIPSIIEKFSAEFNQYKGIDVKFDTNISIPKIYDFDETSGQFVFEKDPKEFRSLALL